MWWETRLAPVAANGLDVGCLSVEEGPFFGSGTPAVGTAFMADFPSVGGTPVANTAATEDAPAGSASPGFFRPTGAFVIGRVGLDQDPVLDVYHSYSRDDPVTQEPFLQTLPNNVPSLATWSVLTASGDLVHWLDIADGIADSQSPLNRTEFLITAEMYQGTLHLVAYALTDASGNPIAPALAAWLDTGIPNAPLALVVSNGNNAIVNGQPQADRMFNQVMFIVKNAQGALLLHGAVFDARNVVFLPLDTGIEYPVVDLTQWASGAEGIAALWIVQHHMVTQGLYRHWLAVSIPPTQ